MRRRRSPYRKMQTPGHVHAAWFQMGVCGVAQACVCGGCGRGRAASFAHAARGYARTATLIWQSHPSGTANACQQTAPKGA